MTTVPLNGVDMTWNDSLALLTSSWQPGIPSSFTYDFPRRPPQLQFLLLVCGLLYVQATCKVLTAVLTIPGCVIWHRTHRHTGPTFYSFVPTRQIQRPYPKRLESSIFPRLTKGVLEQLAKQDRLVFWSKFVLLYCVWNVTAHTQKPDFVFRRNGRIHLNWRGRQFSRLLAAEVCASVVVMLDTPCSEVVWRILATHSIRQFPLYFPSRASPCAITFQLDSTYQQSWECKFG